MISEERFKIFFSAKLEKLFIINHFIFTSHHKNNLFSNDWYQSFNFTSLFQNIHGRQDHSPNYRIKIKFWFNFP
ncbi:hypothetical protein BpHYR1_047606 [Brachionus plicatilis]|uniref:Uncharacterized protein n=1 Tax=Brachionus plicatilis TaxID=10195 RepID=A0A3M7RSN4_BRAPC|nr:hypothetical protein BpHYR1_047606 [Brachionus plicatilis]